MAGATLLGAKCLPSAGAARASIKSRVSASVLALHFSGGGLRGPVPWRDLSHLALSPASWVPALPAGGTVQSRACPSSWPPAGM